MKRKISLLDWRLCLQTSGILRLPAIPDGRRGGKAAPAWSSPGVSAQVASLQSLTLCSGQLQCRHSGRVCQPCSCRRSGGIVVVDREE